MQIHRAFRTIAFLLAILAATSVRAADRQVLRHRIAPWTDAFHSVDRLPATNRIHAAICLPWRNPAAPEAFTEQFGPTPEDYASVVAFARKNGLNVTATHPNRMLVDVEGAASDFERVFHLNLRRYSHPLEKRLFRAPDTAPSVEIAVPVLSVCGLDDYALPHPASLRPAPAAQTASATPMNGSGPIGNLMGLDFRAAYAPGVTLTGSGQSVGLLEFDGYYASDIATYASQAGLPGVPLQNVLVDGFGGKPGVNNSEVAMDIEMAISMAPGLDRVLVYEAGMSAPVIDVLNRMATDNAAKQLSSSWTWGTLNRSSMRPATMTPTRAPSMRRRMTRTS